MNKLQHFHLVYAYLDGMKHWHKDTPKASSHRHYWAPPHQQSNPIDIEMSSYALLVYAHKKQIPDGLTIMKWLTTQRNANGGFASTQVILKNILCSEI